MAELAPAQRGTSVIQKERSKKKTTNGGPPTKIDVREFNTAFS